ncbi:MAG: hypothetical protein RDV48_20825 [Candidatus Eremiobacteraeota bacterium]|nr:hypothetical protein [Candidatus Eremiobacteraeota bacterium]
MRRSRGYILVLTIIVMVILLVFGIAYANYYRQEKGMAQMREQQVVADAAADGGIQDALLQLKSSPAWNAGFPYDPNNPRLPHAPATYQMTFTAGTQPYSTNNGAGSAAVTGYKGRQVPAGSVHLVSVGRFRSATCLEEVLVSVKGGALFQFAALTDTEITLGGNKILVDSYDSAAGPYAPGNPNNNQGNLATNADIITLNGGPTVLGTQATSLNKPLAEPPAPPEGTNLGEAPSSGTLNPGIYTELELKGPLQLAGGTYVFTGDVQLSGSANLLAPTNGDKVTIYILGDTKISGNSTINGTTAANPNPKPGNFLIYGGSSEQEFEINGVGSKSNGLYFALYAPHSDVKIGGNSSVALHGAIASNTLTIGGSNGLHYDLQLNSPDGPQASGLNILSRW